MSQSFLRTTVSVLTLNALLAVYENQPIEFYEYAHGIHPPRLNAFIPLPQYFNPICVLSVFLLRPRSSPVLTYSSIIIALAVIVQNLKYVLVAISSILLPKTLNMILIYYQFFLLIVQLYALSTFLYEAQLQKLPPPPRLEDLVTKKAKVTAKKPTRKEKEKKERALRKPLEQVPEVVETVVMEDQISTISEFIQDFCKPESADHTINETEPETENLFDVNHHDLSEISSVKADPKPKQDLLFTLKRGSGDIQVQCEPDNFDSCLDFLKDYTESQLKQIKIQLLLNLYDNNDDSWCKHWALRKLLQLY